MLRVLKKPGSGSGSSLIVSYGYGSPKQSKGQSMEKSEGTTSSGSGAGESDEPNSTTDPISVDANIDQGQGQGQGAAATLSPTPTSTSVVSSTTLPLLAKNPPSSASSESDCAYVEPESSAAKSASDNDLELEQTSASASLSVQKSPKSGPRMRTLSSSASKIRHPVLRSMRRTIYTAGRPPWYDPQGQHVVPCVIGICGGSASGKTTVADKIIKQMNVPWVTRLSMDSFYKVLDEEQHQRASENDYNFDVPDAFDFDLLIETLKRLREGKRADVPVYNFVTHRREPKPKTMYGADIILFEGILTFHNEEVRDLLDVKIFVDADADSRLSRRIKRDIRERGHTVAGVVKQYNKFVKPAFEKFIAPQVDYADVIIPYGHNNRVAIKLIVLHVFGELQSRGLKVREKLAEAWSEPTSLALPLPESLFVLPSTSQIRGLHTFIRSIETPRDEFIFYSRRLIRLLIEHALSLLPFKDIAVETPQGVLYQGKRAAVNKLCGVSILRAGETMEQALSEVVKDIRIGKILIQTNEATSEPELHYLRLPRDIADYHVMLMDATVSTGAAAMMAIRILLDHDVPEENIMLLSLLMARSGVYSISYAYPKVKVVTTAVDPHINEKFHVMPGIGNFGDRYFGTEPCEYF